MYCINYVTILPLSSQRTQSGCALTQKTQRGQTVLWQQLHQTAKSLSQLYLSTSGTEGQNLGKVDPTPKTLLWKVHMVFSTASFNISTSMRHRIVQSQVWLRAACTMSNDTCCEKCHHSEGMSDLGKVISWHKQHCYLPFC